MRSLLLLALALPAAAAPKLAWFETHGENEFHLSGSTSPAFVSSRGWRSAEGVAVRFAGARTVSGKLPRTARFTRFGLKKSTRLIGQEALFERVYPGVDLRYHLRDGKLEFDFELTPGASPAPIRFTSESPLGLTGAGDLAVEQDGGGRIVQHKPVAWTEGSNGRKTSVSAGYRRCGAEWCLALGPYDRSRRLIIDPSITFGTYAGGEDRDSLLESLTDTDGNLFVVTLLWRARLGLSPQPPQFLVPPQLDSLVAAKFTPKGGLVYATEFPVSTGFSVFDVRAAADRHGNLYLTASNPNRPDFSVIKPTSNLFPFGPVMLHKLNAWGDDLLLSTYLPGAPAALAVDADGNIYSAVRSASLAATEGAWNTTLSPVFITPQILVKFNPLATRILAATYLENPTDFLSRIAIDSEGNLIVAGTTSTSDVRSPSALQTANAGNYAYLSEDDGRSFRPVELRGPGGELMLSIVPDPNAPARLWGHDAGNVLHKSEDFGGTWNAVAPLPPSETGFTLRAFSGQPDMLAARSLSSQYWSRDGGQTWSAPMRANDLSVDPDNADHMFMVGPAGITVSRDGGKSFVPAPFAVASILSWTPYSAKRFLSFGRDVSRAYIFGFDEERPVELFNVLQPGVVAAFDPFDPLAGYIARQPRILGGLSQPIVELGRLTTSFDSRGNVPGLTSIAGLSLLADPRHEGALYVSSPGHLMRSADGGRTWTKRNTDYPAAGYTLFLDSSSEPARLLLLRGATTDLFVTRFSPDLSRRLSSTTFGGNDSEGLTGLGFTPQGNIVLAGTTMSTNWAERLGARHSMQGPRDAFVAVFSSDCAELRAFRLVGGVDSDLAVNFATDEEGNIALTLRTTSPDFATSPDAVAPLPERLPAAGVSVLTVLDSSLKPLYTTGFPGNETDSLAIAGAAGPGYWWIAGSAGSANLPTPASNISNRHNGNSDVYVGLLNWR